MKILFIHPALSLESRYGSLAAAGGVEPPFGICYLAAVVRQAGYTVDILDAQALNLSLTETIEHIQRLAPNIIGVSATSAAIESAFAILREVKRLLPACKTLLGGCHISAIPEETMDECPAIDIGVIGEAEITILRLLSAFKNPSENLAAIGGIIFNEAGWLKKTPPAERVLDLDTLPFPAFDLLPDLSTYYRVPMQSVDRYPSISLITSRGCVGQCAFCDLTITGRRPRCHSAEYTFELIRWVRKEFGIRAVMFEDDNFLMFRKRLKQMAQMMQSEKLDLTWSCTARVDMVNREILATAKSMGCWQILYGIETGSQKILDLYRKNITPRKVAAAIRATHAAGLRSKGFLMLGNPMETKETVKETLDLILSIPLNDISLTFFTPYPGSPIYNTVEQYGRFKKSWANLSCFEPVFIPWGLTKEELLRMEKKILMNFYFRPHILLDYLLRIRNLRHFQELMYSGLSLGKHILSGLNLKASSSRINA